MGQRNKLRKLKKILKKVKSFKEAMEALTDEELSGLTEKFKSRLKVGETLDELLPEAFAAICEADKRVLGMYPFDVQIMAGIALHQGLLAEMNTGEGKTLTATLPLYLNALTGKSTMLMTTNDYLARRDAMEMGPVYEFMGLSIKAGVPDPDVERFSDEEKKEIYQADIVYTTHGGFGFDYLFNNLVLDGEKRFLRELYYVIIDEADSVLLDAAATPLVIAGSPRVQSNLYEMADFFVTTLEPDVDYECEEKAVWLTDRGVAYAERYFRIDNFYGREHFEINRHVTLALRAHALFEKGKDYMVTESGEIALLDGGSGRLMQGVKLRGGQSQALEQKEGLSVTQENRSVASVTYQNLFLLFEKMSGMSGTISDAKDELRETYGIDMVVIPTNRPLQRKDYPDKYYKCMLNEVLDAMTLVIEIHKKGQPVLIVASTIRETEIISKLLYEEGIAHSVLNANNAYWEAEMIREAGQLNAVTVSTSMAGRGTDIKLGEGVKELGGLAVIGIGRMSNVRNERQARGRAGRQGDPGFSRFFVSLEDETVLQSGMMEKDKVEKASRFMSKRRVKKIINQAQQLMEENSESSRKHASDYDQVMKRQRELMYAIRNALLDGEPVEEEIILKIAATNIHRFISEADMLSVEEVNRYVLDEISYQLDDGVEHLLFNRKENVEKYLNDLVKEAFDRQKAAIKGKQRMEEFCRIATLTAMDEAWIEQVDYLQQLQTAVSGRASAQRNPVYEYQKEAFESYQKMEQSIYRNMVRNILLGESHLDQEGNMQVFFP